jgi:hypothetical protein
VLNKTMRPSGCKLVITETTAEHWQDFVKSVKGAIKMMKDDPKLNTSSDIALYGMAT